MKNNRPVLLTKRDIHIYKRIVLSEFCLQVSVFDLCWPQMTLDFYENQQASFTHQEGHTYQNWVSPRVCSANLSFWPLLTSNDLGFRRKSIGYLYSLLGTYIPNMSFARGSLWKFQFLTFVDLKWFWIFTQINRVLVLTMGDLHTKYELHQSLAHQVNVFTRFSVLDLCWPRMTLE